MEATKPKITVEELNKQFAGKRITLTHLGYTCLDVTGTCSEFQKRDEDGTMDVYLSGGGVYGLIPDTLTDNAVEGEIPIIRGRRKISIHPDQPAKTESRPFHETIVEIIGGCEDSEFPTFALLINRTEIPTGFDEIIQTIERRWGTGYWAPVAEDLNASLRTRKQLAEAKAALKNLELRNA